MSLQSLSTQFISTALSAAAPSPLSYTHQGLTWLIRDHLLALLAEFPSLSPSAAPFVHPDGTTVRLLRAQGQLPTSPPTPTTIWLHENYPFAPPIVFVPPTPSNHPFLDRSSGTATCPYLDQWKYPRSDLVSLARELVNIFQLCPLAPCYIDRLVESLRHDKARHRAKVEDDIEHLTALQARLIDRATMIDSVIIGLDEERTRLKRVAAEMANEADMVANGVRAHRLDHGELEGFEAADGRSRRLLEGEAAALAIDDLMDALGEAVEEGAVSFRDYIKQVRTLSREQFFHRALISHNQDQQLQRHVIEEGRKRVQFWRNSFQ